MYARITHYQVQRDKLDEALEIGRGIRAEVARIPGLRAFASFSRDDGKSVVIAVYENKAAAGAAAKYVTEIWEKLAAVVVAPPMMEEYANVLACDMVG